MQENPATRGTVLCSIHPSLLSGARLVAGRSLPVLCAREVDANAIPGHVNARLISELDRKTPDSPEFRTVETVKMPIASSSEFAEGMRLNGIPVARWLPHYLRRGPPEVKYRIEGRVASADGEAADGEAPSRHARKKTGTGKDKDAGGSMRRE
jgi:hypothetical protein